MPNNHKKDSKILLVLLLLTLGLLFFLIGGCKVQKSSSQSHEMVKKDSANTSVTKTAEVFDSSTILPEVKISSIIPHPCDSFGILKPINQTVDNGKAHAKVFTRHDTLYIDCNCDATINRLRIEKYKSDSSYRSIAKVAVRLATNTTNTKIVNKTPWYVHLELAGLALIILVLVIYIVKLKVF